MSVDSLVEQYLKAEADRVEYVALAKEATRRKGVMVYRMVNTEGLKQNEIGEMFGLTKQRIGQLIQLVKP